MNNLNPKKINWITIRGALSALWIVLLLGAAPLALGKAKASDASPARPASPERSRGEQSRGERPQINAAIFETWLARGPQYLLSQVVPVPVTEGKRFHGFRLTFWFPGHPGEVSSAWVRPGDVITRVNGRSVERPDQFLSLWKRLGESRRLLIEGWREETDHGQTSRRDFAVTFDIIDSPKPQPTPDAATTDLELKQLKAMPNGAGAMKTHPSRAQPGAGLGE